MGKNSKFRVVPDFSSLESLLPNLKLEVPKLQLQDQSKIEEEVEEIFSKVQEVQTTVKSALKCIDIAEKIIASQENPTKQRIARALCADKLSEAKNCLDECLGHKVIFLRAAAAEEYLNYQTSRAFTNLEEIKEALQDLCKRGLLVEDQKGPIFISYQRYSLGDFGIEAESKKALEGSLSALGRKYLQLTSNQREGKKKSMEAQSTITAEQFFKGGIEGICILEVPPECSTTKNGQTFWRGGGSILLKLQDGKVLPLDGTGCMEALVTVMKAMGVELQHYTLSWDAPPGAGKAFEKVRDGISRNMNLSKPEAEHCLRKMQALWNIIQRAKKNLREKESLEKSKEALRQMANITAEEFFGINCQPAEGVVFLQIQGFFKEEDKKKGVPNPFCLVKRIQTADGTALVVLQAYPEEAKTLFPLNREFKEEEGFSKLPLNLRRFLEAAKSQMDLSSEIAKE